jgi:hypothetical protein
MGFAAVAAHARNGGGSKGGFPAEYKRMPPARKREWLAGDDAAERVRDGRIQFNQIAKETKNLEKARVRIGVTVPSPARLDEQQSTGAPFPPQADDPASQMRTADRLLNPQAEARVLWPTSYLSGPPGAVATFDVVVWDDLKRRARNEGCGDHEPDAGGTESCSAASIQQAIESPRLVVECKLEPESTAALLREIQSYHATQTLVV